MNKFWCKTCNRDWIQGEPIKCICEVLAGWTWIVYEFENESFEIISNPIAVFESTNVNVFNSVGAVLPVWIK